MEVIAAIWCQPPFFFNFQMGCSLCYSRLGCCILSPAAALFPEIQPFADNEKCEKWASFIHYKWLLLAAKVSTATFSTNQTAP